MNTLEYMTVIIASAVVVIFAIAALFGGRLK